MLRNLIATAILACIFDIVSSKNTFLDISRLLNEIGTQDTSSDRDLKYIHELYPNTPSRHRHGKKRHHEKNSPNLMNIQTMNLYMKPNQHNLDHDLRTETDIQCDEYGRCGCTGTRCGVSAGRADQDIPDEVDAIIDEVNTQLKRDTTSDTDDTDDESEKVLRCAGDRCGYERNREVDSAEDGVIVVLDTSNLDLLDNEDKDLTKNVISDNDETQMLNLLYQNRNSVEETAPTPDEFVNHYRIVRNDVIQQLLHYMQGNTPLPLKHLHDKQKQLLRTLKNNYNIGLVKTEDLKSKIVEIVFGEKSGSRIHPHIENNDNIYVPRWHYNSLLEYKKDLRSKRLLPLTTQQRKRLIKKQAKTIPKLASRRSIDENVQKYGLPFNLEVHGLGQFKP